MTRATLGLAEFIDAERVAIVAEWETFARSLARAGERDDRGRAARPRPRDPDRDRIHAALRIENGFKLGQMVAEYRALRASVLRLWEDKGTDPGGVTRFNEAVDEALTEAVACFMKTTEHFRDQSLGILGHDLRNPLSAIIMGATVLVATEKLDDKSVLIASRMLSSGKRMNRMIGDLLDLTRTRFGDRIPIVRQPMDLEPLCMQVIAELDGLVPAGSLRFTVHGDLRGEWDGDRIAQVLSNLVRNAIQHGAPREPISLVARGDG